jgi:hypothetical protein
MCRLSHTSQNHCSLKLFQSQSPHVIPGPEFRAYPSDRENENEPRTFFQINQANQNEPVFPTIQPTPVRAVGRTISAHALQPPPAPFAEITTDSENLA